MLKGHQHASSCIGSSAAKAAKAVFELKSDVWSFEVVIWEILSLGQGPYKGQKCSGAALTIPRKMHHINGNSTEHHPPPPPLPPHQIASVKKKSVTINTFTTVVEPFEEEEEIITRAI